MMILHNLALVLLLGFADAQGSLRLRVSGTGTDIGTAIGTDIGTDIGADIDTAIGKGTGTGGAGGALPDDISADITDKVKVNKEFTLTCVGSGGTTPNSYTLYTCTGDSQAVGAQTSETYTFTFWKKGNSCTVMDSEGDTATSDNNIATFLGPGKLSIALPLSVSLALTIRIAASFLTKL